MASGWILGLMLIASLALAAAISEHDPFWYLQERVVVCEVTTAGELAATHGRLEASCPAAIRDRCQVTNTSELSLFVLEHCDALVVSAAKLDEHPLLWTRPHGSHELPSRFVFSKGEATSLHGSFSGSLEADGICEVCRKTITWRTIQRQYLVPPDMEHDYDLQEFSPDTDFTQYGQRQTLRDIEWNGHRGHPPFFIEAGAFSGLKLSNTIDLEMHGWHGLLIEANPTLFNQLLAVHRKAWSANVCLAIGVQPSMEEFDFADAIGGVVSQFYGPHAGRIESEFPGRHSRAKVPCFPLLDLLQAIGHTTIDFFSLDVEGGERAIVHTFDWSKMHVRVLCMESDYDDVQRYDLLAPHMDFAGCQRGDQWWRTKAEPDIRLPFPSNPDLDAARFSHCS